MSITVLSVVLKMHAAGGFNYRRFLWLRNGLAFTFRKSHLFRNPRENICIMHSAFSNYLLLKGRITPESSKKEPKMEFPMKFGFCLLTLPRKEYSLRTAFLLHFPMSLKQTWCIYLGQPREDKAGVLHLHFSSGFLDQPFTNNNIYFSFPLIKSHKKSNTIYTHMHPHTHSHVYMDTANFFTYFIFVTRNLLYN